MCRVNDQLQSLAVVLDEAESRLTAGSHAANRVWPTGFDVLDTYMTGGLRSGELVLLSGPQGLGKTTFALQILRNVAQAGRSAVYFSFEHDPQSVLQRLIAIEGGEIAGVNGVPVNRVREAMESVDNQGGDLAERLMTFPGGAQAVETVAKYAEHLLVHRSSGNSTTLETVTEIVDETRQATGQLPLVVVDYLQKVRMPDQSMPEEDRITAVVEGLKDLSLERNVPVLAVVAADKSGIEMGKRMRVQNMRGSSSLAYEADVVLIMNDKYDVVARHHLVYNTSNAERFRDWAVITIEKNRSGLDRVDLEFRKRFEQGRFETAGSIVTEQLVDERVYVE
jgi:replicative DNA helicase